MLDAQLKLPTRVWSHLNFGWAGGFTLAGILNLYVAYNFSEAFWVSYKLIGGFGLTLLYVLATVAYLAATGNLEEPAPAEDTHEADEAARES
jgi:intracellular septation protein